MRFGFLHSFWFCSCDHPNRYHVCVMSPGTASTPSCSSGWTSLGGKCYSPSTTGQSGCTSSDCDEVVQRCTNQGARLTTRGELHAWLANGGSRSSTYGATSTRSGSNHWLLNGAGDYGWHTWSWYDIPLARSIWHLISLRVQSMHAQARVGHPCRAKYAGTWIHALCFLCSCDHPNRYYVCVTGTASG